MLTHEAETANRDFDLSGGEPIELREMLRIIGKELGKEVRFVSCPFPIAYAGACALWGISFGKSDYREKVQRLCEPRAYSHADAMRAFGYDPAVYAEGVKDEVQEYLNMKKR